MLFGNVTGGDAGRRVVFACPEPVNNIECWLRVESGFAGIKEALHGGIVLSASANFGLVDLDGFSMKALGLERFAELKTAVGINQLIFDGERERSPFRGAEPFEREGLTPDFELLELGDGGVVDWKRESIATNGIGKGQAVLEVLGNPR